MKNDNVYTTTQCIAQTKHNGMRCKKRIDKKKSLLCPHHKVFCGEIDKTIKNDINARKINISEYLVNVLKTKLCNHTIFLNSHCLQNLLSLKESWDDICYYKKIHIDGYWWDLDILTRHIYYLLNTSSMNNPKPRFPYNPLTHVAFSCNGLNAYFNKISFHKIKVNITIKILYDNMDLICNTNEHDISHKLNDIFSNKCRYKLLNVKDSQECYMGIWVDINSPYSEFENMHKLLQDTSLQIIVNNYDGVNQIINNPRIEQIKSRLNKFPQDDISIINSTEII